MWSGQIMSEFSVMHHEYFVFVKELRCCVSIFSKEGHIGFWTCNVIEASCVKFIKHSRS